MGARAGGGAGWRGTMRAGLMSGNSKAAHDMWTQAVHSTAGKLSMTKEGYNSMKKLGLNSKRPLSGAAKKNAQGTLKQLMNMHPTAKLTKALQSGKFPNINPKDLK